MNLFIIYRGAIMLLLCAVAFTPSTAASKTNKKVVVKMECVGVHWGVLFRNSQTPQDILARTGKDSYDRTITYQYGYLRDLQQQIEQLQPAPEVNLDVRTVCLLHVEGKKTIDTLSFNGFEYCQYNGKFYHLTWTLLQMLIQKLPHEQIEIIDFWLQGDPNIKEKLLENEKKANEK